MKNIRTTFCLLIIFSFGIQNVPRLNISDPKYQNQEFHLDINWIDDKSYPNIDAYVSATDAQGFPVSGLNGDYFGLFEDGEQVLDFSIEQVTNTSQPLAIALVIDTSNSMSYGSPQPLSEAINAAEGFIQTLSSQDEVSIVAFSDQAIIVQSLTSDHAKLISALKSLSTGGNTVLYDGIVAGIDSLKSSSNRKILVLLTDGTDSGTSEFDFNQSINEATRWAVPIYPLGFGQVNNQELAQLASLSGGASQIKPSVQELQQAFNTLLEILREQYKITYVSSFEADGSEHKLTVQFDNGNWSDVDTYSFVSRPRELTILLNDITDGDQIGGLVTFEPEVISPGNLNKLELFVDGNETTPALQAPYRIIWDSTIVNPGNHEFLLIATDTVGNKGELIRQLEVIPPIQVEFSQPKNEQQLSGQSIIKLDINSLSSIARIEYLVNDKTLTTVEDPSIPYEYEWDTTEIPPGPYTLKVIVTDINGFEDQAEINIEVIPGGPPWWVLVIGIALAVMIIMIPWATRKRSRISTPIEVEDNQFEGIAYLAENYGLNPGTDWPLESQEVYLGRKKSENDIFLDGISASRQHAVIFYDGFTHVIENLTEDNPIFVGETEIFDQIALQDGDEIQLGESIFTYRKQ